MCFYTIEFHLVVGISKNKTDTQFSLKPSIQLSINIDTNNEENNNEE